MVDKNDQDSLLIEKTKSGVRRLGSHLLVFFSYTFASQIIHTLEKVFLIDSAPILWAFKIVEYAFLSVGLLFIVIFLVREVIRLLGFKQANFDE